MKSLLLKFENKKGLSLIAAVVVGGIVAILFQSLDLMPFSGWLKWFFGVGITGLVLLQTKSMFAEDVRQLGFYHSRLYGMCVGFIYSSVGFYILLKLKSDISDASALILMVAVLATGFFYFLKNSYAKLSELQLIGKNLMEKQKSIQSEKVKKAD